VQRAGGADPGGSKAAWEAGVDADKLLVEAGEVGQVHQPVAPGVHKDSSSTGAARAGHDPVLTQVKPVAGQALEVALDLSELQPRVGDPVVEVLHQLCLGHARQGRQLDVVVVDAPVELAVERRRLPCVADDVGEHPLPPTPQLLGAEAGGVGQIRSCHSKGPAEVNEPTHPPSRSHRRLRSRTRVSPVNLTVVK